MYTVQRNELTKPKSRKDKRFLPVLSLVKYAQGEWIQEMLDRYIFSTDETISNHAFEIYFAIGIRDKDPEAFLLHMLNDSHSRLDEVFALVLSGKYDSDCNIRTVLIHCTKLSRVDLMYQSSGSTR